MNLLTRRWETLNLNERRALFLLLQSRLVEFAFSSAVSLPFIYYTFHRAPEEQAALIAAGKSNTLTSLHAKWRAVDLVLLNADHSAVVWTCPKPPGPSGYLRLGEWWERQHQRCVWGGRWSDPFDPYHFQLG